MCLILLSRRRNYPCLDIVHSCVCLAVGTFRQIVLIVTLFHRETAGTDHRHGCWFHRHRLHHCWMLSSFKEQKENWSRRKQPEQSVRHGGINTICILKLKTGGGDSSVVRAPDSWLKGRGFESLLERRENFLLQCRLSVLTLISVSVPPPCYHSST